MEIKVSPCLWRDIPETFRAKGRPAGGGGVKGGSQEAQELARNSQ